MTKFLNTAITAAPTPCAPSRRPPPRYGQRKRCRCRAPSWLQYSPPARESDCYEKLRSGCPQCQDGDGRHGCQRGFGPRCSRRVLRPAQFPPSYRRRLFVVLDLGACPNICSCSRMAAGFRWALAFSASAQPCARTIPLNLPRRCRSGARSSKDCGSSISVATRPTLSPGLATETCGSLART
jgi:hypothetical protein